MHEKRAASHMTKHGLSWRGDEFYPAHVFSRVLRVPRLTHREPNVGTVHGQVRHSGYFGTCGLKENSPVGYFAYETCIMLIIVIILILIM